MTRPFHHMPTRRQAAVVLHDVHARILAVGGDWEHLPAPARLPILDCARELERLLPWFPIPRRRRKRPWASYRIIHGPD